MKKTYLVLSILGFVITNVLMGIISVETGNILLWTKPAETIAGMYANKISTVFAIDLLFVVMVFMIWSWHEAKRYNMKGVGWIWLSVFIFGLAGPFPLFLYLREKKLSEA